VDEYAAVVKLRLAGKAVEPAASAEPLASPGPADTSPADTGPADASHDGAAGGRAREDDGGAAATG
jgi:1-acyl-sn-glycerol-3-phosphate acyltransferase